MNFFGVIPHSFFTSLSNGSTPQPKAEPQQPQPVRLLVVDDDTSICDIVSRVLKHEKNGWQIECAHSLHETLEHLAEHRMDVILLDLCIGDSDGIETLERVLRVANGAAIVVLSGLEENETAPDVMLEGAQDFISKPKLNVRELPRRLCQAIELKRRLGRIEARNRLSDGDSAADTFGACHV